MGCGGSTESVHIDAAEDEGANGLQNTNEEAYVAEEARGPDLSDVAAAGEVGSAGCAITHQRFMGKSKELRSKGFTGRVRMI